MALISIPNTFIARTKILSAEANANFSAVSSTYNVHDPAQNAVHGIGSGEGNIVSTKKTQNISDKLLVFHWLGNTGVKPKVYYIDPSTLNMVLASPNTPDIHKYQLVVATGDAGIGAYFGEMSGVTSLGITAPVNLFLQTNGLLAATMPSGGRIIQVGRLVTDDIMLINLMPAEQIQ